jgi:short-subunit dehydrogenase
MEMDGKVVVVTGASMGIGEAIAGLFADRGAIVVLLSRDASRAEAARHRVGHAERTLALSCDVRHREEIDRALGLTLHHFNRVDVWVNNAGVGMRDAVAEMQTAVCRELFDTNFFGMISCIQAVAPVMRQSGGGTIVNISSVAGHIPLPFGGLYSASKFAMNALGKTARMELRRDNIHVLTVCPGYVRTDFGANMISARKGSTRPQAVRGIRAERVARAVYQGYRNRKREVIVPWTMIPAVKLYQLFPGVIEWGMGRMLRKL